MNPFQCFCSVGCRWLHRMLGAILITMSLIRSVDADSPVVRLTNGSLQWSLPKNPECGARTMVANSLAICGAITTL